MRDTHNAVVEGVWAALTTTAFTDDLHRLQADLEGVDEELAWLTAAIAKGGELPRCSTLSGSPRAQTLSV